MLRSLFAMCICLLFCSSSLYTRQFCIFHFLSVCLCGGVSTMGYFVEELTDRYKYIQGIGICLRLSVCMHSGVVAVLIFFYNSTIVIVKMNRIINDCCTVLLM